MATALPGPSSFKRVEACPASEVLPHSDSTSEASHRGDVIHAFLAACNLQGRAAALEAIHPEYREVCASIDLERLPPLSATRAAAEVAYAYDVETGAVRELGRGLARDEARALALPSEVVGTADWAGVAGDAFIALDWKTGRRNVDPASINHQVRTYGLLGARAHGLSRAIVGIVRVLDEDTILYDVVEMDALDLEAAEADMLGLLAERQRVIATFQSTGVVPRQHEGLHCTFCPAFAFCPAKTALVRSVLQEGSGPSDFVTTMPALSRESIGPLFLKLELAQEAVERMLKNVKGWVKANGAVSIPGGYELSARTVTAESVRAEEAEPLLKQLLGEGFVADLVEVKKSITKDALGERVKQHLPTVWEAVAKDGTLKDAGKKPAVAPAVRALMDTLARRGAVSFSTYERIAIAKPKPPRTQPTPLLPMGQVPDEGPATPET